MASLLYSNTLVKPKLPARLMAFEEARGRERDIITFLVHQPQYIEALAGYDLTSEDFVHSSVACKQATSVTDRSGRRMERTADVLVEHSELVEVIELFWKSRGKLASLAAAVDLLYSNKLAAARASFDQRQLQIRWEGAKQFVESLSQAQSPVPEDFSDALLAIAKVSGKKPARFARRDVQREKDEYNDDFSEPLPARQHEESARPTRSVSRPELDETPRNRGLRRGQRVPLDLLEFDPSRLDPDAAPPRVETRPPAHDAQSLHSPDRTAIAGQRSSTPMPGNAPLSTRQEQQSEVPSPGPKLQPTVARQFDEGLAKAPAPGGSTVHDWPRTQKPGDTVIADHTSAHMPRVLTPRLAPKVRDLAPAASRGENLISSAQSDVASLAPVRSPFNLPPQPSPLASSAFRAPQVSSLPLTDVRFGQRAGNGGSRPGSSLAPLSSYSAEIAKQLFSHPQEMIPAPCHPLDEALRGGFSTGRIYALSSGDDAAIDDFLAECAEFAALNGTHTIMVLGRLTREHSWVRGIARLGKIDSRLIEKRPWLSNHNDYSERARAQIARAIEKYNRLAERITLIENQQPLSTTDLAQIVKEVRVSQQLEGRQPMLIVLDHVPHTDSSTTSVRQVAADSASAIVMVARASEPFTPVVAADYTLHLSVESTSSLKSVESRYQDHPAILAKAKQLARYFPPDPEGAERSALAVVSVRDHADLRATEIVMMYQRAFHNFVGIEKLSVERRG